MPMARLSMAERERGRPNATGEPMMPPAYGG